MFQHSGQIDQATRAGVWGQGGEAELWMAVRSLSVVSLLEYCISLLCLLLISFDTDRCVILSNYQIKTVGIQTLQIQ